MAGPSTLTGLTPPPEYAAPAMRSKASDTPTARGAMLPKLGAPIAQAYTVETRMNAKISSHPKSIPAVNNAVGAVVVVGSVAAAVHTFVWAKDQGTFGRLFRCQSSQKGQLGNQPSFKTEEDDVEQHVVVEVVVTEWLILAQVAVVKM